MFTLVFGAVSGLFHKWDSACIDNHIFRLHYRGSVIILLAATALVSEIVSAAVISVTITMTSVSPFIDRSTANMTKNCFRKLNAIIIIYLLVTS